MGFVRSLPKKDIEESIVVSVLSHVSKIQITGPGLIKLDLEARRQFCGSILVILNFEAIGPRGNFVGFAIAGMDDFWDWGDGRGDHGLLVLTSPDYDSS